MTGVTQVCLCAWGEHPGFYLQDSVINTQPLVGGCA